MSIRLIYSLSLAAIIIILSSSIYFQFYDGFEPCPLCSLQRLSFLLLGIVCILGLLLNKYTTGRFITHIFMVIGSILGIFFAGRQVWLQHFPASSGTECGVSLQYMLQVLPMNQVVQKIFEGTAECTQRDWHFLYLTMAEWSLIWFILFCLIGLYLMFKANVSRS